MCDAVHHIFRILFGTEVIPVDIDEQEITQEMGKTQIGLMHMIHRGTFVQCKENLLKQVEPFFNT